MQFSRRDDDNLITVLDITIEPQDYLPEFRKQLNDIKKKGNFKGFRKGKTPDSFVVKMYGKSILAEVVSKEIDEAFKKAVEKEQINYVAQPLPASEQELDFDPKDLNATYNYSLKVGLVKPFTVKGIDETDSYVVYDVEVDQKEVDEQIAHIGKTFGTMESTDSKIEEDDILKVSATELDGKKPKKDGWMASFDIVMKSVGSEDLKKKLLKLKKGDSFQANIKEVTNRPEDTIRKQLLGVEDGDERVIGDDFSFVIEDVERLKPAEVTDDLIKEKLASWGMATVDEVVEDFKKNRANAHAKDANALLYREIMDTIMDKTKVEYSTEYLNQWLKESEKLDDDKIVKTMATFGDEIKWIKIKEALRDQFKVELTEADVNQKLAEKARSIMSQYGFYDEKFVADIAQRLRSNSEEYYKIVNTAESEKLFEAIAASVKLERKKIASSEFYALVDKKFGKDEK